MRFITEFELDSNNEQERLFELANKIKSSFGWQNPVNENILDHRLEIEAFPMEKWVAFKQSLMAYVGDDPVEIECISDAIKELESFGTPVTENTHEKK
jgi:hypothetical protein